MNQRQSRLKDRIDRRETRVAVVGFGFIGTVTGAVIADRGYQVVGVDVRPGAVDEVNRGTTSINEPGLKELIQRTVASGTLRASSDFGVVAECDVIVVTVGTPLGSDFDPDTRDIVAAAEGIGPHLRDGHLVVLKSTVPPRTTDDVVRPFLQRRAPAGVQFDLAFCPERLAEGRAIVEFQSIPVVVGGVDAASTEIAAYFWERVIGVQTMPLESTVAAELVKLADNLWIDLNVALANEVALLAERLGVDALQVIEAANTLPKGQSQVNILAPSIGVGGYCLTKDPWFVHHLGKQLGLELVTPVTSRTVNDRMPEYSFGLITRALADHGKDLNHSKVAVLGIAFKNNTGDCRFTPTRPIIQRLESSGCRLAICDPWVNSVDASLVTSRPLNPSIPETVRDADCVAFFTGHDEFRRITVSQLAQLARPGAVILDGRNFFSREQIREARAAGFDYRGIGR